MKAQVPLGRVQSGDQLLVRAEVGNACSGSHSPFRPHNCLQKYYNLGLFIHILGAGHGGLLVYKGDQYVKDHVIILLLYLCGITPPLDGTVCLKSLLGFQGMRSGHRMPLL